MHSSNELRFRNVLSLAFAPSPISVSPKTGLAVSGEPRPGAVLLSAI